MSNIILIINFRNIHDTKPTNVQNAGLIAFLISLLCKNSPINDHANGHKIKPNGPKNNQTIIHIRHHRFHHFVHQNFLVHNIGK